MKCIAKGKTLYHRMPLKSKLILFSTVLVFLCTAAVLSVAYWRVSDSSQQRMQHMMDLAFSQAYNILEYKTRSVMYASAVINTNSDLQEILTRSIDPDSFDIAQQVRDMQLLERVFSALELSEYIYQPCVYVPGWLMYANQNLYFQNYDLFAQTDEYKRLMDGNAQVLWLPPQWVELPGKTSGEIKLISMLRKIRSTENVGQVIGIQRLSILAEDIDAILYNAALTNEGLLYLQNERGELISCSNPELLERIALPAALPAAGGWETVSISRKEYLSKATIIPNTDWRMVALIPFSEIMRESRELGAIMLWMMLGVEGLGCLLSYWFANTFTKRIRVMMSKMNRVREGDLSAAIENPWEDEIGNLGNSFNFMVRRLSEMAGQQYESGKAIKQAELRALQAQINPHFLYNTLDLIKWEAMGSGAPKIADIALSLARYYKLSLNKGKDTATLQEEVQHVQTYMKIQNYRFDQRFRLYDELPQELRACVVPKLILQPLVENALLHGLLEKPIPECGTIVLLARREENEIVLSIQDNGVGMSADVVAHLMDEDRGYGIRNVDTRLKLFFGEGYGLSFVSRLGQGTVATLRFPIRNAPPEPGASLPSPDAEA